MGIIKAAAHAVGTGLADQWLEALEPDNMFGGLYRGVELLVTEDVSVR